MDKRQGKGFFLRRAGTAHKTNALWVPATLISLIFLASCAPAETPAASTPSAVVQASFTETVVSATITPFPTPTITPSPTLPTPDTSSNDFTCTQAGGVVETHTIESQYLPRPLQFDLYLPPCYDPQSETPYPVLYLLHGQSDTQEQWLRNGLVDAADTQITSGAIPPLVIVLPYEAYSLRNPFDSGFETAIPDELLPWMEENYTVCGQRACRAIGGISRGGAWALHLGFTRWELFSAIGAHSAPLFFGSDQRLPAWLESIPPDQLPHLALDVGDRDHLYKSIEELHVLLQSLEVAHAWQVSPGIHNDAYWSAHTADYLGWYGDSISAEAELPVD